MAEDDRSPPDTSAPEAGAEVEWSFYFWTPSANLAYERLVESLLYRDHDGSPRGLRVIGESRFGKSSFVRNSRLRLAVEHPTVAEQLVVAEPPVESRDVDTAIRQQILIGAKHPMALMFPAHSVVKSLSEQVLIQCSGLLWDEGHAFYKDKTPHFREMATTVLRLAMNRSKKPIILLGVPLLDRFIALNNELNNRLRPRAELRPFSLGTDSQEALYVSFLTAFEKAAPVGFIPTLQEDHMVLRTFCASDGYPGHFMDVGNRVVKRAIRNGEHLVGLEHWADAFATEFPERASVFNPFDEGYTLDELVRQVAARAKQLAQVIGEPQPEPKRARGRR